MPEQESSTPAKCIHGKFSEKAINNSKHMPISQNVAEAGQDISK